MTEAVVIAELKELDFDNTPGAYTGTYSVRFVRMKDEATLDELLSGKGWQELPDDAFLVNEPLNPSPLPMPAPIQMGYPAIGVVKDAVTLAKNELRNPESKVRKAGFGEDTPIYFFVPNQKAKEVGELLQQED